MKKGFKLLIGVMLLLSLISCNSDESTVKKSLPGVYTRDIPKGEPIASGYDKEVIVKHLKGNEYRISCTGNNSYSSNSNGEEFVETHTPDVFDFEISSVKVKQKSDSISEYSIQGFVTNVVENGTTISYADDGINNDGGITLIIGKNTVEILIWGNSFSSIRKK